MGLMAEGFCILGGQEKPQVSGMKTSMTFEQAYGPAACYLFSHNFMVLWRKQVKKNHT